MDNDNLASALKSQIQISIALIGTVKKPSIETLVLAKRLGITPEKAQKVIQATTQRGIRTCSMLCCQGDSEQMIISFVIIDWHILYFHIRCLPVHFPEGVTGVNTCKSQTLDGLEHFQSHPEVKLMRLCHYCLQGMVIPQHEFVTMPRK